MLASQRPELLWYSLLTVGLGWGGLYAVLQLQIVGAFGLSSAGKILGTITLVDAITAGMGINFSSRLDIPYVDVRVTGNEIRTASTNAIALGAAVRPVIRDNRIHTLPGAPVSPRIYRGAAWTDAERAGKSVDGRLLEAA